MFKKAVRVLCSLLVLVGCVSGIAFAQEDGDPAPEPVNDDVDAPEPVKETSRLTLAPRERMFPPRMFSAPTGEILPSLSVYAASGWSVGFTDKQSDRAWVVSAGLGGVGEVILSSTGITHVTEPSSDALAGFRIMVPLGWISQGLNDKISLAANLAASDESQHNSSAFTGEDDVPVESLSYTYRETTVGAAMTLHLGERTRLNGVAHVTDLRATNIQYRTGGGNGSKELQKEVYPSFSAGLDYAANPSTHVLLEARTVPYVGFRGGIGELTVDNSLQGIGGIRFFPLSFLGFDATVSLDDRALGIGDMEIGFGLHLILSPAITKRTES